MKLTRFCLAFLMVITAGSALAGAYDEMIVAIRNHDREKVVSLLQRGMDVNTADQDGTTLVMHAARMGDKTLLEYLLEKRANVLIKNKNGDTAINLAALHGQLDCVKLLVKAGAEINPAGGLWTPLSYAAFSGQRDISAYLIEAGAHIDARAPNGMTSLMLAARNGHLTVVQLLLESHADRSLRSPDGLTALDIARNAHQNQIAALLDIDR